jgi:hypothetical protein
LSSVYLLPSICVKQESAEDDCVVALVGNKTDLCDDDDKRPVKYKDGAKLADVKLLARDFFCR